MTLSKAARKAAALGLSTLLLGGMALPYAQAEDLIGPERPTQTEPAKAQSEAVQHPLKKRLHIALPFRKSGDNAAKAAAAPAATVAVAPVQVALKAQPLDPTFHINPGVSQPLMTLKVIPAAMPKAAPAVETPVVSTQPAATVPAQSTTEAQLSPASPVLMEPMRRIL